MKTMTIMSILAVSVFVFARCAHAQTAIECGVVYQYGDDKKAVREQAWEEGWTWSVESAGNTFRLVKKSSTFARFETDGEIRPGECTILLTNKYGQIHTAVVPLADRTAGKAGVVATTITKRYNKIILRDKAGLVLSGDVYFAPSGLTDPDALRRGDVGVKCPPAAGGGYSFPSIRMKGGGDYSIYVPDSKKGMKEISYQSKQWYGRVLLEEVKLE